MILRYMLMNHGNVKAVVLSVIILIYPNLFMNHRKEKLVMLSVIICDL